MLFHVATLFRFAPYAFLDRDDFYGDFLEEMGLAAGVVLFFVILPAAGVSLAAMILEMTGYGLWKLIKTKRWATLSSTHYSYPVYSVCLVAVHHIGWRLQHGVIRWDHNCTMV